MDALTQLKTPKTTLRLGMGCLAVALLWPRFLPVTANLGPDAIDGTRGLLFGLAIGLNLLSITLRKREPQQRGF
jgi:hypothetical protein